MSKYMFFSLFQIFLSNLIDINFDFKTLITDSFVVVFLGASKFCVFCGGNACFIILQWTRRTNQELVVEEWPWGELELWKKYFMDFLLQNIFYCNMSDQKLLSILHTKLNYMVNYRHLCSKYSLLVAQNAMYSYFLRTAGLPLFDVIINFSIYFVKFAHLPQ